MKDKLARLRTLNHRHYIAAAITLAFVACGIIFHNALPRLAEAFRDLGTSVAFYVMALFSTGTNPVTATVNTMPSWEFAPTRFPPLQIFPWTWEEFKVLWGKFTEALFTVENLAAWWYEVTDTLYILSRWLLILMPLVLVIIMLSRRYTTEQNNDNDVDSAPLRAWRAFTFRVVYPVRDYIASFVSFLRENSTYTKLWLTLWVLYFHVAVLFVEAIAYYLYLISSFDFASLYTQLVKLLHDLAPAVRFLPGVVWACIGVITLNKLCEKAAYDRLQTCEAVNTRFVEKCGVVTGTYGPPGIGKTTTVSSLALTAEVKLRNDAFEILIERDMMFPAFPWCHVQHELRRVIEESYVVDVDSCRAWARAWEDLFIENMYDKTFSCRDYKNFAFGYDVAHYPMLYDGELGTVTLFDAIEDYACAYLVFTVQTSLIIANYSIRTDEIVEDLGNMPLWNSDFFKRDPRLMDSYSRYAHIIDFDMLRLGKRMLEDNPNRNAFGFGVYVISEIDKERKNALELRETKKNTDECNQVNDLFNVCLKMSRHACVIANRVFLKIFFDLQRPEDWGAGGREVGEIVFIAEKGDMHPALPFISTYWWTSAIYAWLRKRFDRFYQKYIHVRADNTLFVHLAKSVMAALGKHYKDVEDRFGVQALHLECESGRMDGNVRKEIIYRMPKKDYSRRYCTDCLSAIFEGDKPNRVSINDLPTYAGVRATSEELEKQNSHFQRDIQKRKQQYS